jgi:hypothetical protein
MNTLPQYPSIKSWAAMKTAVLVSAITTPPRDRVKGCSLTCGCSNTRVPKTVPSWERTSHSLAYLNLSYPVSLEDTIAEKVYVPLLSIAVALKTCTQPAAPVIRAWTERRRPSTRIVTQGHEGEILVDCKPKMRKLSTRPQHFQVESSLGTKATTTYSLILCLRFRPVAIVAITEIQHSASGSH